MKTGDRVKIDSSGRFGDQIKNSEGEFGIIEVTKGTGSDCWFRVKFPNEYTNNYQEKDLIHDKSYNSYEIY
jgi:hypothetical protein